jgi:hypothetical protein
MRSSKHAASLLLGAAAASFVLLGTAHATVIYSDTLSLDSSDPTQLGRLSRSGVPSSWASQKAFPGVLNPTTVYHYTTYDLDLSALESSYTYGGYLQITFDSVSLNTFLSAYSGSYNPTNIATNYLGDEGGSGNYFGTDPVVFQLAIPKGSPDLVLVLNESVTNGGLGQSGKVTIEAFSDTLYTNLAAVPEPSSWALMSLGLVGLSLRKRRDADLSA